MRYNIKLEIQTPLMLGGRKSNTNYAKSKNYITGRVFYAALAREIWLNCGKSKCEKNQKDKYWVSGCDDSDLCKKCRYMNLCNNFGNIKTGFFYPFGLSVYPFTAKICKNDEQHVCDMLIDYIVSKNTKKSGKIMECFECGSGEGKLENLRGYNILSYSEEKNMKYSFKENTMHITRSSIDPYRNASKKGHLFSHELLAKLKLTHYDINTRVKYAGLSDELNGYINLNFPEKTNQKIIEEIMGMDTISIGAMTSIGYGKCQLFIDSKPYKDLYNEDLENRLKIFNTSLKSRMELTNKIYIPIMLQSDAYFFENNDNRLTEKLNDIESRTDTSICIQMLKEVLVKDYPEKEMMELELLYTEQEILGGFDTSKKDNYWRNPSIVFKAGSTFVLSTNKEHIDYNGLKKAFENGIGLYTEHGFGKVIICNEFHSRFLRRAIDE